MTNELYSVMVDDNNKLLFPTAEEIIDANPKLGGSLPDNIQVSDNGYILSIDTTGVNQPNILLQGTETNISGLSCNIEAPEGISLRSNNGNNANNISLISKNIELGEKNGTISITGNTIIEGEIYLKYGDSTVIGITDELTLTSNAINVNGYTYFNSGLYTSGICGDNGLYLSDSAGVDTTASLTYDKISLLLTQNDTGANFDFNRNGSFTGYKHAKAESDPDTSTGFNLSVDGGLNITSIDNDNITNIANYSAGGISLTDSTTPSPYELDITKFGIMYRLLDSQQLISEITLNNNGINVKPQSSNKIGGVEITGEKISIKPIGNYNDLIVISDNGITYDTDFNIGAAANRIIPGDCTISGMLNIRNSKYSNAYETYTKYLLDCISKVETGDIDPETKMPIYEENTYEFDKTTVGLDYFYKVIKELNDRITELEAKLQ
jgi:hypothetical protein